MPSELSPKQKAFCREYMVDCNGGQAAIRAGYAANAARSQAARLLTKANIQAEIAKLREEAKRDAFMGHQEAWRILSAQARANVGDYLTEDGQIDLVALRNARPEAVQSVEVKTVQVGEGESITTTKFRLHDRTRTIERIAKLRGWDQPARIQTEDVTPPQHDLSKLSDKELRAFEKMLEKIEQ